MDKTEKNVNKKSKKHDVFITLISIDAGNYFGEVKDQIMRLNPAGEMAAQWTLILADEFGIKVDAFIIMPNHMHLLLEINDLMLDDVQFEQKLTQMMEWFMAITTREYHSGENKHQLKHINAGLWKNDFSYHLLKTAKEIQNARQYIADNPRKWHLDLENPESSAEHGDYYGNVLGNAEG